MLQLGHILVPGSKLTVMTPLAIPHVCFKDDQDAFDREEVLCPAVVKYMKNIDTDKSSSIDLDDWVHRNLEHTEKRTIQKCY
jgi:hypothetical protein